jgi:predicted MFS family arabinose efflux permease
LSVDRVPAKYVLGAGLVAVAFGYVALFRSSSLPAALAVAVGIGLAGSVAQVTSRTVVQRGLPNSVVGRVSAVFFAGEAVATLVGALVGPVIAQATTLSTTAVVAGAVTFLAGLWCLRLPAADSCRPD